jgi:hypothetical protein
MKALLTFFGLSFSALLPLINPLRRRHHRETRSAR